MTENWFSDEALRKQAALAALPEGEPVDLDLLCGVYEARIPPTDAERCVCCGNDARPESYAGGDGRHCGLCLGRGHDEDDR